MATDTATAIDKPTKKPSNAANMGSSVDQEKPGLVLRFFGKVLDFAESMNIRCSKVGNPPVYQKETFPWALEIEKEWEKIQHELRAVLERKDDLPNFQDISADVKNIQSDNNWKTFFFYGYGLKSEENCRRCPETDRLLQKIPGMKTAFFSILSPGKHIPHHRGPYNGVLRYHLGLIIPQEKEKCRIRVDDQYVHWTEGESMIFDDSFDHEVWNDTNETRVILFVDFLRPLSFPANLLNRFVIWLAMQTPFIKGGKERHADWEKAFYREQREQAKS